MSQPENNSAVESLQNREKVEGIKKSCDNAIQLSKPQECNGATEGTADTMCH